MANEKKAKVEVETPQVEETVTIEEPMVETPKVEVKPKVKKKSGPEDGWEIKDRMYYLLGNKSPLTYLISGSNIHYWDEDKGYERELKYCSNQRTCFVDEMNGDQRLEHIIFRNGALMVRKEKTVLQKFLSLYHPHRDKLFKEHKPKQIAADQIDILELEIEALNAAKDLDIGAAKCCLYFFINFYYIILWQRKKKQKLRLRNLK